MGVCLSAGPWFLLGRLREFQSPNLSPSGTIIGVFAMSASNPFKVPQWLKIKLKLLAMRSAWLLLCSLPSLLPILQRATVWWFQDAWHSLYIEILHTSAFLTVWFLFPGICSPTCSIWCISSLPFHTQMCSHLGSFPGTPGELPFSWLLQWLLLTFINMPIILLNTLVVFMLLWLS